MPAETKNERTAQEFCYEIALTILELKPNEVTEIKLKDETLKIQRLG
jgi:hypothetical protein